MTGKRILHSVVVTPGRCGLYETTRDLVDAERKLGHNAFIVDPKGGDHPALDRGVPIIPLSKCLGRDPDVIVEHSGLTREMRDVGVPLIHVRHGRPHSTLLLDHKLEGFRYFHKQAPTYGAIVTFWPEHVDFWHKLTGQEIDCITPPVDLDAWSLTGSQVQFPLGTNVVVADGWRPDTDPFEVLQGLPPSANVHVFGITSDVAPALRVMSKAYGFKTYKWATAREMAAVYRTANVMVTPNKIATRCLREAMACGCAVVGPLGCTWTPFRSDFQHPEKTWSQVVLARGKDPTFWRRIAEDNFNHLDTGAQFLEIVERVTCGFPVEPQTN